MGYLFTITNSGGSLPEQPSGSLGCPLSAYGSIIILLVLSKKTGTQRKIQRIQNKHNKAVCRMQCVTIQTCSLSHTITFLAVYFPYFRVGREMPLPQIFLFPVGAGLHPWFQWRRFLYGGGRGRSPQRGPGAEPLVRRSEDEKKLNFDNTKPH